MRRHIVIARYNEDVETLVAAIQSRKESHDAEVFLYNKGAEFTGEFPPNWHVALMPNVGMCDHTYVHHIVSHYDDLPDVTVFLPGSFFRTSEKMAKFEVVMGAEKTRMVGHDCRLGEFYLERDYLPTTPENADDPSTLRYCPAETRPFSLWYAQNIGMPYRGVSYQGIFAADRMSLRRTRREKWEELQRQLSACRIPEVAHYMERSWFSLLQPEDVWQPERFRLGMLCFMFIAVVTVLVLLSK